MCTVKEFGYLVRDMRKAQNDYFRTRSSFSLTTARSLERKVDEVISHTDFSYFDKRQEYTDRVMDLAGSLILAFSQLQQIQQEGIFANEGSPEAVEALEHSDVTISSLKEIIAIHRKNRG